MRSRLGFLAGVLAPALLAGAGLGGCGASKTDVQLVQGEVVLLKAEMARRDSARAAQLEQVIQVQRQIMDSLASTRRSVAQIRGEPIVDPHLHVEVSLHVAEDVKAAAAALPA